MDVPSHISFGSSVSTEEGSNEHHQAVRLLRVLELLGGSSAERMADSLNEEYKRYYDYAWHFRGLAGVGLTVRKKDATSKGSIWEGDSHRVELRSLLYKDPEQYAALLKRAFYLGKALLSPDPAERKLYTEFDWWFQDYQDEHGLPDISRLKVVQGNRSIYTPDEDMIAYMTPFAEHLQTGNTGHLKDKVDDVLGNLGAE